MFKIRVIFLLSNSTLNCKQNLIMQGVFLDIKSFDNSGRKFTGLTSVFPAWRLFDCKLREVSIGSHSIC